MKNEYEIDGHKLDFHIDKVASWKYRGDTTPVYIEISPTALCNHHCSFCALDFTNHVNQTIPTAKLIRIGTELAQADVRGVMFGGEGEPTLHKGLPQVIEHYTKLGVSCGLTTNGSSLGGSFAPSGGCFLTWVKVSMNGVGASYASVHGVPVSHYDMVWDNICAFRTACTTPVPTMGVQTVVLQDNIQDIAQLCKDAIKHKMDYIVLKPFNPGPYQKTTHQQVTPKQWSDLVESCHLICDGKINLTARSNSYYSINSTQLYDRCLSVPYFWSYIRSNMDLIACSNHMQDTRFILGNLDSISFKELWYSNDKMKRESLKCIMREFDVSQCRKGCRMNKVNEWLWKISKPNSHKDFI